MEGSGGWSADGGGSADAGDVQVRFRFRKREVEDK